MLKEEDTLRKKSEINKAKSNKIKHDLKNAGGNINTIFFLALIGVSLEIGLTFWGFTMWYLKIQKFQDVILATSSSEYNLGSNREN